MKKIVFVFIVFMFLICFASVSAGGNVYGGNSGNVYNQYYATPTPTYWKNIPKERGVTWKCKDATSYDGNAYNDNKCTNSKGIAYYVCDSQAEYLDPTYKAGKSGAYHYNNK